MASAQPSASLQLDPLDPDFVLAPLPADVLTPNTRQNTPYFKIAARAGINWAAYSNDRYLDNTMLDVGKTSGESDIYAHNAGFGYGGGLEFEYPINTGLSVVGLAEAARINFGDEGIVDQECVSADGASHQSEARHDWSAQLTYLKIGAVGKLSFPSFYMVGGLTGNSLVASRVRRNRAFNDDRCSFPDEASGHSIAEDSELTDPAGIHFSLRIGFGLVYQIADRLQFSPELTLDFGLTSINKSPESDLDSYNAMAVLRYELR